MGRNTVTHDSKILIREDRYPDVLDTLQHDSDETLSIAENLDQCLGDYSIARSGSGNGGVAEFYVDDGDTDEDYDIAIYLKLADFLEEGSFYELSGDEGLSVFEVKDGLIVETLYDYGDDGGRGEMLQQVRHSVQEREPANDKLTELLDGFLEIINSEAKPTSEKPADRWAAVRAWWRTDDPEWVKERNREWRVVAQNLRRMEWPAREIKAMRHFFLTGEDPADTYYFSSSDRFYCAPVASPEQAKQFFDCYDGQGDTQLKLTDRFQRIVSCIYDGLPRAREMVLHFQQGVLGETYTSLTGTKHGKQFTVTPEPESIVDHWFGEAYRWLKVPYRSDIPEFGYFSDTLPYIRSVLLWLNDNGEPIPGNVENLAKTIGQLHGVLPMSGQRRAFCEQMISEWKRNDLPKSVADAVARKYESRFYADQSVAVETQLEQLASVGIELNADATLDDLLLCHSREVLESKPYASILAALGTCRREETSSPISEALWLMAKETEWIEDGHAELLRRLEGMTGSALDLSGIEEFRDKKAGKAWVKFKCAGKTTKVELAARKKTLEWDEPFSRYDALLKKQKTGVRLYICHKQLGNYYLIGAFTEAQIKALRKFSQIEMYNVDEIKMMKD